MSDMNPQSLAAYELKLWLDKMREEWGIAPNVELACEVETVQVVKIKASFNMAGFPHEGRRSTLLARRGVVPTIKRAVKAIAQEIVTHRVQCTECGVPAPSVWERLSHARGILDPAQRWEWLKLTDDWRCFYDIRTSEFVEVPFKATTLLLWVGPMLLMIAGLAALYYRIARRRREVAQPELSGEEHARAAALLSGDADAEQR